MIVELTQIGHPGQVGVPLGFGWDSVPAGQFMHGIRGHATSMQTGQLGQLGDPGLGFGLEIVPGGHGAHLISHMIPVPWADTPGMTF